MSRKITEEIVGAFNNHYEAKKANTESTGSALYLHGNKIAEWREDGLWITNAGWSSNTTKERLNGLRGVSINQKDYQWYLNGLKWDGSWVNVKAFDFLERNLEGDVCKYPEYSGDPHNISKMGLGSIGMIAKLGDIFYAGDQKASNDWKTRMLKAGLTNSGLIMPEDWDTLSEEEKATRLDGAIKELRTN